MKVHLAYVGSITLSALKTGRSSWATIKVFGLEEDFAKGLLEIAKLVFIRLKVIMYTQMHSISRQLWLTQC